MVNIWLQRFPIATAVLQGFMEKVFKVLLLLLLLLEAREKNSGERNHGDESEASR